MANDVGLFQELAPDLMNKLNLRFVILQGVYRSAPIGRRVLANQIGITERVLRTEIEYLKDLQLVNIEKSGMTLTSKGLNLYRSLEPILSLHSGSFQEDELSRKLGIQKCTIVAGDADRDLKVLESFGHYVTVALRSFLNPGENIIAVMGGTTMAIVAENMESMAAEFFNNIFVPARGGIGESVAIQANSVSAKMAERTGGRHIPLYVPEQVSKETYETLLQEPSINRVLSLISQANCVIHGVGAAIHMAERRGMSDEQITILKSKGAVSESLGYFYDKNGIDVYRIPRMGLQQKELGHIPNVIAVVGGSTKANVIQSYMKQAPKHTWLITDEGAANEILKGSSL